jgi:predicted RNase H-like HicB family nuclease
MFGETVVKYTVIIEPGRESGFVAHVPTLRGCVSQGETKDLTLANLREAVEVYIEALLEDGLPVPTELGKEIIEIEIAAR